MKDFHSYSVSSRRNSYYISNSQVFQSCHIPVSKCTWFFSIYCMLYWHLYILHIDLKLLLPRKCKLWSDFYTFPLFTSRLRVAYSSPAVTLLILRNSLCLHPLLQKHTHTSSSAPLLPSFSFFILREIIFLLSLLYTLNFPLPVFIHFLHSYSGTFSSFSLSCRYFFLFILSFIHFIHTQGHCFPSLSSVNKHFHLLWSIFSFSSFMLSDILFPLSL